VRTQVGIIGAGPAGLTLSHLLARQGIDSVVLESRSREYVESRVRAGVLEHATVELLREIGVAERLDREGLTHEGFELRFSGAGHRIAMTDLTGRWITIYGQQEVVKDLIAARLDAGGEIRFDAEAVAVDGLTSDSPSVRFRENGAEHVLECEVIAGCDGYHGISRPAVPDGVLTVHDHEYPFGWLGVLAEVAPSSDELIYASHERGFALHSLRSPEITRLYLQCAPDEDLDAWPDDRIWEELHTRFATDDGWTLREGPIIEKGVTAMRGFVTEPMQYGRLFILGDAAHIVPPTGAKGLNLAVADVTVLADALEAFFTSGRTDLLETYSEVCLRRVWRTQYFSSWMTRMLHRFGGDDAEFERRLQLAQLDYVTSSEAASRSLAENYAGLPFDRQALAPAAEH
jgi:p-hydroxybenzoate 3-monooxygenase